MADEKPAKQNLVKQNLEGQFVPYQPPSSDDALKSLYSLTGIPDLQEARQAAGRGEYLEALGQGAYGAAQLAGMVGGPIGALEKIPASAEAIALAGRLGIPADRAGELGVLAGAGAKTAPVLSGSAATLMEKAGASPRTIWNVTGWYRDVDGMWKWEISDQLAALNEGAFKAEPSNITPDRFYYDLIQEHEYDPKTKQMTTNKEYPKTVGDILYHPGLFAAYPELSSTPVGRLGILDILGGTKGAMSVGPNQKMYLGSSPPDELLSTILHEAQHYIQQKEDFALGGSPSEFFPEGHTGRKDAVFQGLRDLDREMESKGIDRFKVEMALYYMSKRQPIPDEFAQEANKAMMLKADDGQSYLDKTGILVQEREQIKAIDNEAHGKYQSLAGESEARNVQLRHKSPDITPTIPTETAPVRGVDQLIKRLGGE